MNSKTKKVIYFTLKLVVVFYIVICVLLFFFQEKIIFFPQKLSKDYKFNFPQKFEEINIKTRDGVLLNNILFRSDSSKGVIFYLHGNAGSLSSWGEIAKTYTDLNYDVLMLDYRGFGKSEGSISGQRQFLDDIQTAYDYLKEKYQEQKIIVLGYSIGSGPAAWVASNNNPKLLIIQAPYYSLVDMMRHRFPIIPTFILKYQLQTGDYMKRCKCPVIIFHGDQDEVIYYGSSLKLQKEFKVQDTLITLKGQTHNGITENDDYQEAIKTILSQ